MAHPEQRNFFISIKNKFPERFKGCDVLDVGGLDINGNNRYLFEDYAYTSIDVAPGKNVTIVSLGHEFDPGKEYDIVISSECFEHDMYWDKTIMNCVRLTKSGGLTIWSAATTGRQIHGTSATTPSDSPLTLEMFNDYYRNITQEMVEGIPGYIESFSDYGFEFNTGTKDIYFWGIKK